MKTIFLAIITILALVMSGCSNAVSEPDMSDVVYEADMPDVVYEADMPDVVYEADMPDIVFKVCTVCNPYEHHFDENDSAEQGRYLLAFVDKNGNYYNSDYSDIYFLSNEELIEALKSGDERITKTSVSCDVDELRENYKKLLKVAGNKEYELVYPKEVPTVVPDSSTTWYGLYYDKDGNLSSLPIHEREVMDFDANDDRANEIFEWYRNAAKT